MKEIAPAILFGIGSEKRADDPRTREGKMRKFMSSKVTQSEIRPKNWLIKFIREIYDLKFQSEPQVDVDRMFGQSNREPMPDFIFGYLTTKYGLRPLIDQQIEDLLNTVNKYRQNDSEVNIFASFMEEILSPDELAFFLHARNLAIHGITAGAKYPIDRFSTLAEYLDLIRAVEFSKTILENLHTPIDQIGLFLRAVESISVAAPSLGNSAYLTSRSLSNGESRRLSVHTQEKDQSNPKHRRVSVMELLIMLLTHLKDHQRKNAEKLVDFFKAVDGTNAGYINEEQFGKSIHTLFPDAADEVISFVFSDVVNKSTDEQASKGRMSFPTFVQAIGKMESRLKQAGDTTVTTESLGITQDEAEQILMILQNRWLVFQPHFNAYSDDLQRSQDARDRHCARKLRDLRFNFEQDLTHDPYTPDVAVRCAHSYRRLLDAINYYQEETIKRNKTVIISTLDAEFGSYERTIIWRIKSSVRNYPHSSSPRKQTLRVDTKAGTTQDSETSAPAYAQASEEKHKMWYPDELPDIPEESLPMLSPTKVEITPNSQQRGLSPRNLSPR